MRRLLAMAIVISAMISIATAARAADIYRTFGDDSDWHFLTIDAATGLPSEQCYMSDGAGVAIDSRTGALVVALEDGSGGLLQSTGGILDVNLVGVPGGGMNVTVINGAGAAAVNVQDGGNVLTVDGSGVTQPISAVALPLPAGAATEATLGTLATQATVATLGTEATLATLATQATAATLATEATAATLATQATLAVVAGDTTSLDGKTPALGAALTVASVPVNVASDQTVPVSAAALPLPAGAATEATLSTLGTQATLATLGTEATLATLCTQATLATVETNTDFGAMTGGGVELGALRVTLASDSTGLLSVDDNGAALTVDNAGAFAVQAAQSGVWNITDVTGTVSLPTGASTAANQATANASLATIAGDTTSIDGKTPALGAALTVASWPVNVASDQVVPISAAALPLPAGASTEATLATIDADTGVIAGDTTSIDGKIPALGQALMAASTPVTLASDQSTVAVDTTTGTVTDSAAVGQDASWRNVADGGATADANKGAIPVPLVAGTVVKLYLLPVGKEYHEVSIAQLDTDGAVFEYSVQVFGVNDVPSAAWALADWMSVGGLLVPSFVLSQDRTKTVMPQPLVRTHATYLLFIINTMTVSPATTPFVRIWSYNDGDSR